MNTRALTLAFRMGVRQAVGQPFVLIGQLAVLSSLVVSYGSLISAVPTAKLAPIGLTTPQMVWYLTICEIVVMVSVWHFRHLQMVIRSGTIDVWLLRPVEFWTLLIAEWAGQELPRLIPVALCGFVLGRLMSGIWLIDAGIVALMVPTFAMSAILILCWCFLLGIVTVWLIESAPLFWFYQKLLFVLGALLWPLAFYPAFLRDIAWATPFPSILATAGTLVLKPSYATIAMHMALQVFWIVVMFFICAYIAALARRRLTR